MRILVLYTGGVPFLNGANTSERISQTLQGFLELQLVADIDVQVVQDTSGADVNYDLAAQLGQRVHEYYDRYDGFVVIHGSDNVVYTANLFTFLFATLGKPVIFTGCSLPDEILSLPGQLNPQEQQMYREMGLRTNLVTAVQLATLDCSGTFLAYGPHIIRAVRAVESTGDDLQYFHSWQETNAAEVQFGIRLAPAVQKRQDTTLNFCGTFSKDVYIAEPYPGMAWPADMERYRAVIIKGYHEQAWPTHLALPQDRPVIIQVRANTMIPPDANAMTVSNATFQVILTKTMALLGRTPTLPEFKAKFQHNTFGEFKI